MEDCYLTPEKNELILSPGPGEVLIQGVISHNTVQFKSPAILSLGVERDINGGVESIEIPINSYVNPNDINLRVVEFPLRNRAYDSYMKLSIINDSNQEVDFKIEVAYKWTSH